MKNDVPRLAPPFPPEIAAMVNLEASTATDEELMDAEHLLSNFATPLVVQLAEIRCEYTRRLHARARIATEQAA